MNTLEAIAARHSVRSYLDRPIEAEVLAHLQKEVDACNAESGLSLQLITNEPEAFQGFLAGYGSFKHVSNYLAVVGTKGPHLSETTGYYGEHIVLEATKLGLDSCWVGLTFRKGKTRFHAGPNEKLVCVISLGYGETHGKARKSKPMESLCSVQGPMPSWFEEGMRAAMLAPTATNQQKFLMTLVDEQSVHCEALRGPYAKLDLGIVKYHFEQGAGKDNFVWV
ncbi:MAG: nitroreductase family protein [Raoultibacter sp.]